MIKRKVASGRGQVASGPIGRRLVLRLRDGQQYTGTVIDATPDNKAKRIRVQSPGAKQGSVVMPGEYIFLEWL